MGSAEQFSAGSRYLSDPGPGFSDIQVTVIAVVMIRSKKFLYLYFVIKTRPDEINKKVILQYIL